MERCQSIFHSCMVATKREIMLNLPTQHKLCILQRLIVQQPVQFCPLCRSAAVLVFDGDAVDGKGSATLEPDVYKRQSLAPVILSCIRYPAVPVCKKYAKMCRAKISPLKQISDFYSKPGKRSGSSPKRQLQSCLLDHASNVHQQQRFMAGIWTIEQTSP